MSDPVEGKITLYTDGGAAPNPGPGGWGVVIVEPGGSTRELSGGEPHTTNNRMELTAAIEALDSQTPGRPLVLYTDSTYVRNGITKWIDGWIRKNWKRGPKATEPVLNADLWQRLHALNQERSVDWRWLKGHAGHEYNERADQLASAAILDHGGADAEAAVAERGASAESAYDRADVQALIKVRSAAPGSRWLVLLMSSDEQQQLDGTEQGNANRAELRAGLELLRTTDPEQSIGIRCGDYFAKGCSEWLAGWKRRGWETAGGGPVKNRDLWEEVDPLLRGRTLSFAPLPKTGPVASELRRRLRELSAG